jgi:CRISPR-associated protein Csx10
MIAVTYLLELLDPVLVRGLDGDPNSEVSIPFIPGSVIRGLVAQSVSTATHSHDLAAQERPLLFAGDVRFLNAYPADERDQRTLPAPLSWRRNKNVATPVFECYDEAAFAIDGATLPDDLEALGGFVSVTDDSTDDEPLTVRWYKPRTQLSVHTMRSRTAGRALRGDGAIYQIEALEAGQRFAGAILSPDGTAAERIRLLLHGKSFSLGGSTTAGFGGAQIVNAAIHENWSEVAEPPCNLAAGTLIIVTALSDILLRSDNGVTHTDLTSAFGLPFTLVEAFKGVQAVGAFNRKWGLPTPQALALRAGSVFVLRTMAPVSVSVLKQLMADGIGERRIDGFGRIAVKWQTADLDRFSCRVGQVATAALQRGIDLNQEKPQVTALARQMATRRRQRQLDEALVESILDQRLAIHRAPPNSQLARVRLVVRNALQQGTLQPVVALFRKDSETAMKAKALGYFQSARITEERRALSDWLLELANNPELVWRWMPVAPSAKTLGRVAPDANLAVQYAGRLIDGVLESAMKQRRRQERGGSNAGAS